MRQLNPHTHPAMRRGKAALLLTAVLAVTAATGSASAASPDDRVPGSCREMRPKLGALVKDMRVPGAVVLVRSPTLGRCFLTFGARSLHGKRPIRINDQFRIASNTKTMTGTVILQLVQKNKVRLDDPVSKYRQGVPNGDSITIEQLLTMRSGLQDYTDTPELAQSADMTPNRVWTPDEVLELSFAKPPAFPPGTGYLYSNANTVLLGLIIEKVTGSTLAQAFKKRIFRPLGLRRTLLPVPSSNIIPRAHSEGYMFGTYTEFVEGGLSPEQEAQANAGTLLPGNWTDLNPSFAFAAGAVISTPGNLARYVKALVGGGLLSKRLQRQRLASPQPVDPAHPEGPRYGQAIVKYDQLYGHTGEIPGYDSFMAYDPKRRITLITMANLLTAPDGRSTGGELAKAVIANLYPG